MKLNRPKCKKGQLPDGYGLLPTDTLIGYSNFKVVSGRMPVRGGLETAYWIYTDAAQPESVNNIPVIAFHGGPAATHHSMMPIKLLATKGHPVILYDQCGCGSSSFPTNVAKDAPWLLTVDYYVEEALQLVDYLKLDKYFIYGNSWGTCLAQEFTVRKPKGLLGSVLDGALCDAHIYSTTEWRDVLSTIPTYAYNRLQQLEQQEAYTSKEYAAFNDKLGGFFTLRQCPQPDCYLDLDRTDGPGDNKGINNEIYTAMQGPSEFTSKGVLENWSVAERLSTVTTPTLVLRGEYDTMSKECSMQCVDSLPETTWKKHIEVPKAGHIKLMDEPHFCIDKTHEFITEILQMNKLDKSGWCVVEEEDKEANKQCVIM